MCVIPNTGHENMTVS